MSLSYFPSRALVEMPAGAGLGYRDLAFETDDGERLRRLRPLWCSARIAVFGDPYAMRAGKA